MRVTTSGRWEGTEREGSCYAVGWGQTCVHSLCVVRTVKSKIMMGWSRGYEEAEKDFTRNFGGETRLTCLLGRPRRRQILDGL
jgi:hypothetical protein